MKEVFKFARLIYLKLEIIVGIVVSKLIRIRMMIILRQVTCWT